MVQTAQGGKKFFTLRMPNFCLDNGGGGKFGSEGRKEVLEEPNKLGSSDLSVETEIAGIVARISTEVEPPAIALEVSL